MSSSCQSLLDALKDCLLHTDCVLKQGRLPSECLRDHVDELPSECQSLRRATYDCKRGMLDMRKRMRGNMVGVTSNQYKTAPASAPAGAPSPSASAPTPSTSASIDSRKVTSLSS